MSQEFPLLISKPQVISASQPDIVSLCTLPNINEMIKWKPKLISTALLDFDNGSVFRNCLMPMMYSKHEQDFIDFAYGLVTCFGISNMKMQDVLRNTWGKKLSDKALGINVIPPKHRIIKRREERNKSLTEAVGLRFNEHSNTVFATVNVRQYLEYLLSKPQFDMEKLAPHEKIIGYEFTDLAPHLRWSWHSNALTSCRLKIVDIHNLHSLVITLGAYLGTDSYEMIKQGIEDIYNQLTSLRSLQINGKNIEFIPRAVADGKQRRLDTGKSTAKSSYCIPEAPEHKTQLGDMTIACTSPVEDASLESDYIQFRGTRKESNKIRADFAVTHW